MIPGVINTIRYITQGKQQLNTSNKTVKSETNTITTKYLLNLEKLNKIKLNGSFFSHKKQCFN